MSGTEPKRRTTDVFNRPDPEQGGSHFEFSSEKNWSVEQDECRMFDSIDFTHLADSIASIPFHIRHNIPNELFTVEQLEEFEVESSLAQSRHTFQCNSKLKNRTVMPTTKESNQIPVTDSLMKLILNSLPGSSGENVPVNYEISSNSIKNPLDEILGNMKPLINVLQDETNIVNSIDNSETSFKKVESQTSKKIDSEIEVTNHDSSGHWLDSMLDSDE